MIQFLTSITLKDVFAFIGAGALIFGFIDLLFKTIPLLGRLKKDFWRYLADKWEYKRFEKKAIASDIENAVNETVADLQAELPVGWIPKASIEWVDKNTKENDFKEGEMILRIRPRENQDVNLVNGIYFFFSKAIFPKTKDIVPENARKAVALQISRRTIKDKRNFLMEKFENELFEPTIKDNENIITYIDKFDQIDKQGFLTGSFLREIHEIATRSKFKELRNKFEDELIAVLEHMKNFSNNIGKDYSEHKWLRKGPATSYAFLLVAQPNHCNSVSPYIKRVKERLDQGVERIYIMGTNQERNFVKKVISSISKISDYQLLEIFDLNRDYRGDRGGIGALFVTRASNEEVGEKIENYFTE